MDRKIRYWKEKGKEKKVTNYRDHLQTIGQFCVVYCTKIKWYYSFALVNFQENVELQPFMKSNLTHVNTSIQELIENAELDTRQNDPSFNLKL